VEDSEEEEPERWKAARDKATRPPRRTVVVGAPAPVAAHKPKKRSPVQQLLKVIRASKTCLIALEIEETAQDLRILRAIQSIPEDEIEMFFRDCGFTEETVLRIAELIQEGRPQIEELSTSILRRTWCLVIQILVFCIALVLAASGGFFAISLGYTGASCQFSDFTNGTCQQGNVCKLQVAAWYEGGIAYSSEFSPPVATSESAGLKSFDTNGAFRCCNFAQQAALRNVIPQDSSTVGDLGVGYGSGTPCCDFYNDRSKAFCDNFGTIQQFSHCPAAPWACRLKLGADENGNVRIDELRVWEEPVYVLLLIVAGGMAGLVLLIVSCGFACRHSQRLQACGLAVWRCCRYIANKVGCWRRCKSCCGALCARCRRVFHMGPTAEERAKERRDAKQEQGRQRQAAFTNELRRSQTFGELDLTRNSWKNSIRRWSLTPETKPKVLIPSPVKSHPRPKRKAKKTRVERLKVQEAEEDEAGGMRTSSSNVEDTSDSEKSSQVSKPENVDDINPWSIQDLVEQEAEVAVPAQTGSRPATVNLQSMLRPIMTPMEPQRRPKIVSQKFGLQDSFASTTTSFASGYASGFDTRSSFGVASMSGAGSQVGGMAQTFSEGFGLQAGHQHKSLGEKHRRKRRAKDRRRGPGSQSRTAWAGEDMQRKQGTFRRRHSEQ